MAKFCNKCGTKELFIKTSDNWQNADAFEPMTIEIYFCCNSCGYEYRANQIFNSLNEYHNFLDGYNENV